MKKHIIAVDIDNVLAASAISFVAISNELFGDIITVADFSENWPKMWGVSPEEAERRGQVLRAQRYQKDYLPVTGALKVISHLSKRYNLVAVTSRTEQANELTRNWLDTHFPGFFEEIIFADFWADGKASSGHRRHKGELYDSIKADYVIDDQIKHCIAAAEKGMEAILFGAYPWNEVDGLPAGIARCDDWQAVLEYFDGRG